VHKKSCRKKSRKNKTNPIDDKDVADCIAALIYLRRHPTNTERFEENNLDALESEGLWTYETGVTLKGHRFLDDLGVDYE
jgi:hypothetical protein